MKKTATKKKTTKKTPDKISWHKKIALSRAKNPDWKKNIGLGRIEAAKNPTKLRSARLNKSLAQSDVATKLNIPKSTYASIELGKQFARPDIASKIAKIVGRPINKIFIASKEKDKYKVLS